MKTNLYAGWFRGRWERRSREGPCRVGRAWLALLANAQKFLDAEEAQLLAVRVRWRDKDSSGALRGSVRLLTDPPGAWSFRVDRLFRAAPSRRRPGRETAAGPIPL